MRLDLLKHPGISGYLISAILSWTIILFIYGDMVGFLAYLCMVSPLIAIWNGINIIDKEKKKDCCDVKNVILQSRKTPNKKGYEGNHIVYQITIPKRIIKETGWKKGDTITMHTFGKILKMERHK